MSRQEKIIKIISSLTVLDENEIGEDDSLANLGIDSLRSVELIVALEDNLNVTFDDSDLDPSILTTVKSIIELVEKHSTK